MSQPLLLLIFKQGDMEDSAQLAVNYPIP